MSSAKNVILLSHCVRPLAMKVASNAAEDYVIRRHSGVRCVSPCASRMSADALTYIIEHGCNVEGVVTIYMSYTVRP